MSGKVLLQEALQGNYKSLARCISIIENKQEGHEELLLSLSHNGSNKIVGITGPPGAGKSTLVDVLINELVSAGKRVAVLCIDPSSPFHRGALLGDRIRMSEWYNHPHVFIRSLATRGALGGLPPRIIEITELLKAAPFDIIIIETVGVGQSEIEIAGLADTTVVVMVPEAGDEVQTMKSGLMEIADIFVVNKSDRPDADLFVRNLRLMLAPAYRDHHEEIPIIQTIANQKKGVAELWKAIDTHLHLVHDTNRKSWLLAEKAFQLIQEQRMKNVDKGTLQEKISAEMNKGRFNLFQLIKTGNLTR